MTDPPDENLVSAQRTQEKLEFYVIALTFTVLGFSIQTAHFGRNVFADILELLSWVSLLTSGLVGLWRVEGLPRLYNLFALRIQYQTRAQGIRKVAAQGARVVTSLADGLEHPIADALHNAVSSVSKIEEGLNPWEETLGGRYRWQRRLFVVGFGTLTVARALIPAGGVITTLREFVAR
jgi:hypothetical protein